MRVLLEMATAVAACSAAAAAAVARPASSLRAQRAAPLRMSRRTMTITAAVKLALDSKVFDKELVQ